jgi:regulator of sirC expression with transglutaminase-like and TPR domain
MVAYVIAGALMVVGVFLLYAGSYRNPLVFDDGIIASILRQDAAGACAPLGRRCLPYLTFGLTYLGAGADLFWLRFGNVLCHAAAALACFFFLDRLFDAVRRTGPPHAEESFPRQDHLLAFCGALLFAVHPVTVYGVAYLSQRSVVMATLFSLLGLGAFARALALGDRRWLWLSVLLYVMAVFSKEHAVMLPAVAAAMAVLLGKRLPGSRLDWAALAAVALCAAAAVTLSVRPIIGTPYEDYVRQLKAFEGAAATTGPYLSSALTQTYLFFKYLLLWLVPYPGWMSIDLRQPIAGGMLAWPYAPAAVAFLAYGLAAMLLTLRRGTPGLLGFGLLMPWLLFLTEFVTVRLQEPFVLYRSYLWMAGFPAILPFVTRRWPARRIVAGCAVLALAFSVGARDRLATFSSELALWDDAVRKNTDLSLDFVARGYVNRAAALLRVHRLDEALGDLDIALKLDPRSAHAYTNRGSVRLRMAEAAAALPDFDRAIELDAALAEPHSERCAALLILGQPGRALESCNAALRLAPAHPTALSNRALLHMREQRTQEALADLDRLLASDPANAQALYNRGRIHHGLGKTAEAERDLRQSCRTGFKPAC